MKAKLATVKQLKEAAVKAAARVSTAKDDLKAVKSRLKDARKLFKAEKKSARQLRRKLKEAVAARLLRQLKPKVTAKAKTAPAKPKAKLVVQAPTRRKKATPTRGGIVSKAAAKKQKPGRTSKPRSNSQPTSMRSAAEVAKSVIDRLHAPPPLLPPTPIIPPAAAAENADSTLPGAPKH
jgi:hypothetical protein